MPSHISVGCQSNGTENCRFGLKTPDLCFAYNGTCTKNCNALILLTACTIVIPKRFRYYWDQRPEGKHRKMLMIATLPRLKEKKDVYVKPKLEEEKVMSRDCILLFSDLFCVGFIYLS